MIGFVPFFNLFPGCPFYRFLVILGELFRGFSSAFQGIFRKDEIVEISTTLERQLHFQGLAGFGSVGLTFFLEVWFLDGFQNGLLVILVYF